MDNGHVEESKLYNKKRMGVKDKKREYMVINGCKKKRKKLEKEKKSDWGRRSI